MAISRLPCGAVWYICFIWRFFFDNWWFRRQHTVCRTVYAAGTRYGRRRSKKRRVARIDSQKREVLQQRERCPSYRSRTRKASSQQSKLLSPALRGEVKKQTISRLRMIRSLERRCVEQVLTRGLFYLFAG